MNWWQNARPSRYTIPPVIIFETPLKHDKSDKTLSAVGILGNRIQIIFFVGKKVDRE